MTADTTAGMSKEDITRFLKREFPQALTAGFEIKRIDAQGLVLTLETTERHIRPGGTVSGPTLMTMADTASYFLVLARLGPLAMAVTSNLEIHFLRKPVPGMLHANCRMLKLGRRTAVLSVEIHSQHTQGAVAFATVTYALPN